MVYSLATCGSWTIKMWSEPDVVVHTCNISYSGGRDRRIRVRGKHGQKRETLSEKQTEAKGTGGMGTEFNSQYHKKEKKSL
jgi:hypothetical protein